MGTVELEVPADSDRLDEVMAFITGSLEGMETSPKALMQLELAVEEIFVNISSYAYPSESGMVRVSCNVSEDTMSATITFADRGPEFDPLTAPSPDITLPAEERPIGGLGIFLARRNVDCMRYCRCDGYNVLVIEKRLL